MQKTLITIAIASLIVSGLILSGTPAVAIANPRIVVDVTTGKILEHQEAFQKWYPASLTKMMTAYTVFRAIKAGRVKLESPVVMSKKSTAQPASKIYLKPGDWLTLDGALKIMLVKSANDVSYAIGEQVSGSMPAFVDEMNREAARIGMSSSRFINANGLPGKGQYTTARDLALLAVAIKQEFPEYGHYFAVEAVSTGKREYGNYNLLIGRFAGADGMKTGFICASGFNQVSSATRKGRSVVSIVLGADSLSGRADLSADLLEKGLATRPVGSNTLANLRPYGEARDSVVDISKEICSGKGKKTRSETKDEAGRNKLKSPYIRENPGPLDVELVTIVTKGKAKPGVKDGAPGVELGDRIASVPVPAPRPKD